MAPDLAQDQKVRRNLSHDRNPRGSPGVQAWGTKSYQTQPKLRGLRKQQCAFGIPSAPLLGLSGSPMLKCCPDTAQVPTWTPGSMKICRSLRCVIVPSSQSQPAATTTATTTAATTTAATTTSSFIMFSFLTVH